MDALALFIAINSLGLSSSLYCFVRFERIHLINPIKVVIVGSSNNGEMSNADWYNLQEAYNNGYKSGYQNGSNAPNQGQSWWSSWGKCATSIASGAIASGVTGLFAGAAVGTITFPLIGTVSGAAIGGVGGFISGAGTGAVLGCC